MFQPSPCPWLLVILLPSCHRPSSSCITVIGDLEATCVCVCCVFSQPRASGEHGGARWGYRCYSEPWQLHLPTHTGRPLQLADSLLSFTAIHVITLNFFFFLTQNISILLRLDLFSDNYIQAKWRIVPWLDFSSGEVVFLISISLCNTRLCICVQGGNGEPSEE